MHMCFNDKGKDINVFIHVYEICMHMLKYYESFKMCKECICVLMITNVFEEMFTNVLMHMSNVFTNVFEEMFY